MAQTLFILGGTGFIGREAVTEAVGRGFEVRALARSDATRAGLEQSGARPVVGEAEDPGGWAHALEGTDAVIDLLQPKLPPRLTARAIDAISVRRRTFTAGLIERIEALPEGKRPLLFCVSGAEDLEPDPVGRIDHASPLRSEPLGFSRIGGPLRRLVERSGIDATFVYLGAMVYGPGKVFADVIVQGLRKRRARVIGDGSNRLPLVYVTDAARALVHLAGQPREQIAGRAFLASDGSATTQRELLDHTAELLGRKRPGAVPAWVAGLVAGRAGVETITVDARDDNSALRATGFDFRFPSHREGVPEALRRLGAL